MENSVEAVEDWPTAPQENEKNGPADPAWIGRPAVLVRVLRYSALKARNAAIAASFVAVASSSVLCAV